MQSHYKYGVPIPNMTSPGFILYVRWHSTLTHCFNFPTSSSTEEALLIHNIMLLTAKKKKVQSAVKTCFKFPFSCCLKN